MFRACTRSLIAALLVCAGVGHASAQAPDGASYGIQDLRISYDECRQRAAAALRAEGFDIRVQTGAWTAGTKGAHRATILCYGNHLGGTGVGIVVDSNLNDATLVGAERVRLQQRMDQAVVAPPPTPVGGGCDVGPPARWRMTDDQNNQSVWTFTPSGGGRYAAREEGLGNATGTAVVSGTRMRLDWSTTSGYAGFNEWDLGPRCTGGAGQINFTAGTSGSRGARLDRLP